MEQPVAAPLTASEFFRRGFPGFSKTDAHEETWLAYTAVHDASNEGERRKVETLQRLMRWSFPAIARHNCYLSVARTLGLNEDEELRRAIARIARRGLPPLPAPRPASAKKTRRKAKSARGGRKAAASETAGEKAPKKSAKKRAVRKSAARRSPRSTAVQAAADGAAERAAAPAPIAAE